MKRLPPLPRLLAGIDKREGPLSSPCWIWTRSIGSHGYGQIGVDGRMMLTHRVAWIELVGPIGDGLVIDHLCRNQTCCNPDHLEAVTHRENCLRGQSLKMQAHRNGTCLNGHPLTDDMRRPGGRLVCRPCRNERDRLRERLRRAGPK